MLMQSICGEDGRAQPRYVVYKIHLLHVIFLQVNLLCFGYMDEILDERGAVFQQTVCRFATTNQLFFCQTAFCNFLRAA